MCLGEEGCVGVVFDLRDEGVVDDFCWVFVEEEFFVW